MFPLEVQPKSQMLSPNLGEVAGYIGRAAAYSDTTSLGAYVVQAMFIVIAPAFYSASVYMALSRIIRCVRGEHLSIVPVRWLTWIFVIGDQASLQVQSAASGLTSHAKLAKIGEDIVVAGLFIQLALLVMFFVVAGIFQVRLKKRPTRESYTTDAPWRRILYMVYIVSVLIFLRSIFRVVEYIPGHDGYSLEHEWTLYTFDGVPMFIVAVIFWVWHPASVAPAVEDSERVELASSRGKPVSL